MENVYDFLNKITSGMDGLEIDGDILYSYDEDHKQKVSHLVEENPKYLYAIEAKCGINPFSENYYGEHTGDVTIVNVDHFGIAEKAVENLNILRQQVYDAIDWVYNNRQEALQFLSKYEDEYIEEDPFDLDWDEEDDKYIP